MQNTDSQRQRCPKCLAGSGEPCVTLTGEVADKVHYGRGGWLDKRTTDAFREAKRILSTSPLRPTPTATGVWAGSVFIDRDHSAPYGAWCCPCGASHETLSLQGVMRMNELYAEHENCRP